MSDFDFSYDYNLGYDYANAFVQWDQNTADTTPRCALHASCKIRGKGEEFREYFLSHPCAGEKMYAEKNIIAQPTMSFTLCIVMMDNSCLLNNSMIHQELNARPIAWVILLIPRLIL